jgi:SAM-dependent methyltransferase
LPDQQTLAFYADHADRYVEHATRPSPQLAEFIALLPPGGDVLELGTGNGRDAAALLSAGFAVTPSDASPELAAHAARRLGRPVRVMSFHELDDTQCYDGVWACACLLHAPRDELTSDLERIHRALRPGGVVVASFKAGEDDGRDQFGRYYNYLSVQALERHFSDAGPWKSLLLHEVEGSGFDALPTRWLWITARKA